MAQSLLNASRHKQRTAARCFTTLKASQPRSSLNRIPMAAWDSHMHVIDPTKYPLTNAHYSPSVFTVSEALQFGQSIGVHKRVLVQPSIYGTDNSCLLSALRELGPDRAKGVVVIDPAATSVELLKEWHAIGVRGVRVNLKSVNETAHPDAFARELQRYADIIRPHGWVLDLYVPMAVLPLVEAIAPSLDVKICLDHFASPELPNLQPLPTQFPKPPDPYNVEGFSSLLRLLKAGRTWVKISGAYRFAQTMEQMEMLKAVGLELLKVAPDRVVWASDWPHTRYEGLDIRSFLVDCMDWCGNLDLKNRLFRDNAIELWDR